MKTREKFLIALAVVFSFSLLQVGGIPLSKALKQKLITVSLSTINKEVNKSPSTYWGPCINIKMVNLTSSPISIEMEPGMFLISDDSTTQRLMILDNSIFMIAANKTRSSIVNASCSQMLKSAPGNDLAFSPSGNAEGNLLLLAKLIAKNKYHSYAAQNAVWALTDNNDIESIYCDNKSEMDTLRKFIAKVKNLTLVPHQSAIYVKQKITKGEFKFSFPNKIGGLYTILLFDSNGEQVQEFSKDYDYPHLDKINVTFRFQSMMNAGTYFVRLVRNQNEVVLNKPVIVK